MEKKKGVLYVRVSTTKDEQKSSLEIQETALKSICEQKDIELLDKVYHDKSSGTRIRKRKGFIEMLYDAGINFTIRHDKSTDDFFRDKNRMPKFDYIICKDIFRFGRNSSEAMQVIKELRDNGVTVYFVNSAVDTSADDYKMRLELLFTIAENESHNTSRRVKFSKRSNAKQGKYTPSRLPYGYKRIINSNGEKEIVIDEEQAKIVRFIYERYKEDGGYVISQILNEKGIPTQLGKKWTNDKIQRIIGNEAYYGSPVVQKWVKDDVTDVHFKKAEKSQQIQLFNAIPPIVTKEQFEELKLIRKSRTNSSTNKGQNKSKNDIFFEKVYCRRCGARFVRHTGENQKVTYMCQTRRKYSKSTCNCRGISYNNIVKFIDLIDIETEIPSYFDVMYRQLKGVIVKVIDEISEIEKELDNKIHNIKNDISSITRSFINANEEMQIELNKMMAELKEEQTVIMQQKQKTNVKEFTELLNQLEKRKLYIQQVYRNKKHSFEDKLDFVDKMLVDNNEVEIKIKGLVYVDEMLKFNEMTEGTKYKLPIDDRLFKPDPVKTVVFQR